MGSVGSRWAQRAHDGFARPIYGFRFFYVFILIKGGGRKTASSADVAFGVLPSGAWCPRELLTAFARRSSMGVPLRFLYSPPRSPSKGHTLCRRLFEWRRPSGPLCSSSWSLLVRKEHEGSENEGSISLVEVTLPPSFRVEA